MGHLRRAGTCAAVGAILLLAGLALSLAACGGASRPQFPLPPTVTPTWPSAASPRPAVAYPVQTATTEGLHVPTAGWEFMPTLDLEVSDLGFYDDGQDGLRCPHHVAIFDAADDSVIVEATVRSDSTLSRAFRWVPVEPAVLKAGHEYVMAWDCPSPVDPGVLNPADASLAPELRYLGYRETAQGGPLWGCPEACAQDAVLSGNFKYRPGPASDPATQ